MTSGARILALATVPLLLLTLSCTRADPPKPSPSPTPTPTAAITPTESSIEKQQRLDYEAADQAYRDKTAEVDRLFNVGSSKVSSKVEDTATTRHLKEISELLDQVGGNGLHTTGGTTIIGVVRNGWQSKTVLLDACEDVSAARLFKGKKDITPSGSKYYVQHLTVVKTKGQWKVDESRTSKLKTLKGQACASP